jgi:proline racemase
MCGHGLIGVVRTLEFLDRLASGTVRIDTPVGTVGAELEPDGAVTIENVPAVCHARDVEVDVPVLGRVRGDVAWGGNWFFLAELPGLPLDLANVAALTDATSRILSSLRAQGVTGRDGAEIDHVELLGPPRRRRRRAISSFGLARLGSLPCGTGVSAKMAAAAGEVARAVAQESPTGSARGLVEERDGELVPRLRGRAFVTARATLHFDPRDPFREGFTTAR